MNTHERLFEAVVSSPSTPANRAAAVRVVAASVLLVAAVGAVLLTVNSSGDQAALDAHSVKTELFELPSISLGIREHEALGKSPAAPSAAAPQTDGSVSVPTQQLGNGGTPDVKLHLDPRWNFRMDQNLTWPPHNTDTIPTGAYAKNYKGPYDSDYDWPDDTEVMRNDEWDKSGGVGCGMNANNC